VQGRRGGVTALAAWIGAPATGRAMAVVGVIALVLGAGLHVVAHTQSTTATAADAPHVVLITIDTLRYDHMGVHGYARDTTPNIDAVARQGVRFNQATTPRPKTVPSVVSMMTGLYPHNSGVRRLVDHLHPTRVTMQEVFRNAGYQTGAVICNTVLNGDNSGLAAGFDFYYDDTPDIQGTQLDSAPATDIAIAWLEDQVREGGAPVFLWVHYMDPHGPYLPPAPYDEAFVSETRGSRFVELEKIPRASRIGQQTDVDFYVDQYDGEILYTDHHTQRLLDAMARLGMSDRSVVVISSDHGESLGDHDYYFEHGKYVYDDCSRIPLIVRYPGCAADAEIDEAVELTDLYPTLLDLAGLDGPATTDGVSLVSLLEGGESPRPSVAFIERYTMVKAIRTPEWKAIHSYAEDGSIIRREFYDLAADPAEANDLYPQGHAQIGSLEEALYAWTDSDPIMALQPGYEGEGEAASADMLKKLRALGYVE
jgi:arylsulfatase A-like enzyme